MTPLQTSVAVEVMQGYMAGKEVQYRAKGVPDDWRSTDKPIWDWRTLVYRIKPRMFIAYVPLFEIDGQFILGCNYATHEDVVSAIPVMSHKPVKIIRIQEEV